VTNWLQPFLEIRPDGLYCRSLNLYLDPPSAVARALLSHAHADHAAAGHGEIWATAETIAFYRRRHPEWSGIARVLAFQTPLESESVTLEAFPSGHILGAAQMRFAAREQSLLYTGDFRRRPSRTASPIVTPHAQVLLTEATFGLPVFRFPARSEIEKRLIAACREASAADKTPVILAYALGKAQEAAIVLASAGIASVLHGAAWKLLPEYEASGHAFPLSRAHESGPVSPGEALIVPPRCARTPMVQKIKNRRVIYLSGWAVRAASRAELDADVLLPFSDHADFTELLEHVEAVAPERVVAHHGFARSFAEILAGRGIESLAMGEASERPSEED
jgi:Cft2 family RNA processing exonuclease